MAAKVAPPPERFGVTRTGEPDRLAPPIAVPAEVPEHAPAPVTPERTAVPAGRRHADR